MRWTATLSSSGAFSRAWIRINALFLLVMGTGAALMDLLSYFFAAGAWGDFLHGQVLAVGPFEAHVLAAIFGVVLLRHARTQDRYWNAVAGTIALSLGIANLIWFGIFHATGTVPMGVVVTIIHWVFVAGQAYSYFTSKPRNP